MYYLNKIVGVMLNPVAVALILMVIGMVFVARGRKRLAMGFVLGASVWLWLWGTPLVYRFVGVGLEREWPVVLAEDAPKADAIVILGGGMGTNTNVYKYAEMWGGADRVWHAARLWKAWKAPIIITSGTGDRESTVPFLRDLGIPEAAIVVEDKARNTEENATFVEEILTQRHRDAEGGEGSDEVKVKMEEDVKVKGEEKGKRILLVTSAWHMRRSLLMFKKYAPNLDVIPAATDYEALVRMGNGFRLEDLLPSAEYLSANSACFKEYIGYWGYRLLR